jgi:hypothetical protein
VERFIEMCWGIFESLGMRLVAMVGLGVGWATYARDEVRSAEVEINQLATAAARLRHAPAATLSTQPGADPEGLALLAAQIDAAQQRLADAQTQLGSALKSASYQSVKKAVSIAGSLVMGMGIAWASGLDMFKLLGLVPNTAGTNPYTLLITGLVIGAGSGPVHSVIGLIQQARDATDQAANLLSSRSKRNISEMMTNLATTSATTTTTTTTVAGGEEGAMLPTAGTRGDLPIGSDQGDVPGPVAAAPVVVVAAPHITQQQLRAIDRMSRR